jgi:hypothetical protein
MKIDLIFWMEGKRTAGAAEESRESSSEGVSAAAAGGAVGSRQRRDQHGMHPRAFHPTRTFPAMADDEDETADEIKRK